ncbi:MAG: phage tail protein [Acidimicrobiales bacterium]
MSPAGGDVAVDRSGPGRVPGEFGPAARRLAELLPAALLNADAEVAGQPLRRLLAVLAQPLATLEEAVDRLEADPFVALASAEALPLLAELVGARLLGEDVATNRRVVASTVGWRRRKGTLATLEDVLTQTSGWPVEVDEGFRSLLVTQDLAGVLPSRGCTALVWDPVANADPLTRRGRRTDRHPSSALDPPAEGDDIETALIRLGAPDSFRLAASSRTVDLAGWARPDGVIVRSSRLVTAERDEVILGPPHPVDPVAGGRPLLGLRLDPGGGDGPLAGRVLAEAVPPTVGLTPVHEPAAPAPPPRRPEMLTPTDLAADPAAVEAGDVLRLTVDGVALIGRESAPGVGPLPYEPPGPEAVLRFADGSRPAPGESWTLGLAALTHPDEVAATIAGVAPATSADQPNPLVVTARASAASATLDVTGAGATPIAGADAVLRIQRSIGANTTSQRAGDATWTRRAIPRPGGVAVSGDAVATVAGQPLLVRLLLDGNALHLARRGVDAASWEVVPLDPSTCGEGPARQLLAPGPSANLVADGAELVLVAPRTDGTLGAWRLSGLDRNSIAVIVADGGTARRPSARWATAACLGGAGILLHGGQRDGHPLGDLWELDLGIAAWVLRRVRDQVIRSGGQLVATPGGLVRIGGAGEGPGLAPEVAIVDLSTSRPRWAALPSLPVNPGVAGTLYARTDGAGGLGAVVWADRVRPRWMALAPGAGRWDVGALEPAAPNPPADGEVVTVEDRVLVTGPPPLPASEVIVTVGGRGHLAFLPPIDPDPADQADVILLDRNGSTTRWYPPGVPATASLRLGRHRDPEPILRRDAPDIPRIGAAGRLGWAPLTLRQAVLDRWDGRLAIDTTDQVLLDPRLGRVVVNPDLAGVRPPGSSPTFTASATVARGSGLGAGFVPPGATIPERWREPADPDDPGRFALPHPPEQPDDDGLVVATTDVVGPPGRRWGADGRVAVSVRLGDAIDQLARRPAAEPRVLGLIGSPRLRPTTAVVTEGAVTSIVAQDRGGYPYVTADPDGISLSLLGRPGDDPSVAPVAGTGAAAGPHLFVTGIATGGTFEVAFDTGAVDVRWCDLGLGAETRGAGEATAIGLRVVGAGHDTGLLRATPPEPTLNLRLHGCQVARLEVPPWVQVVAAGCTFDGGGRHLPAVAAAGARLRLRNCTILGTVTAGVLEATACAFAGAIRCDRPDLGWLRRCVAPVGHDRRPAAWRGLEAELSLADIRPTWPHYMVLDDNNGPAVLSVGEGGRPPGAHDDRGRSLVELLDRTGDFLPLGLHPTHLDRSRHDTHRMERRNA